MQLSRHRLVVVFTRHQKSPANCNFHQRFGTPSTTHRVALVGKPFYSL